MSLNIAIVGPGRSKQGTGPFIARTFHQLGAKVVGVVSSSIDSAIDATEHLHSTYGIKCAAYENLELLFEKEKVDAIAICSPIETHLKYLEQAVKRGVHVLCEKALWWPNNSDFNNDQITEKTIHLCNKFKKSGKLLQLNTQWPFTLPTYYELIPDGKFNIVEQFSMWLSPQSKNESIIRDAVPHPLSMLYSIVGAGRIQEIKISYDGENRFQNLIIEFDYLYSVGETTVCIHLSSTDENPKPAAFAINQHRIDRHVELPNYLISLASNEKSLPIVDPLESCIKNFVASIYSKASLDEVSLIDGMTHLAQIHQAVTK